jgi:hypothetical protein
MILDQGDYECPFPRRADSAIPSGSPVDLDDERGARVPGGAAGEQPAAAPAVVKCPHQLDLAHISSIKPRAPVGACGCP